MKKYILIVKSLNFFVVQNFLGYHYSVIYKKLHKHSHWGTQETLTVTQETLNWRYMILFCFQFKLTRDCKTQTRKPKPGFRYQTRNPGLKSKPKNGFQVPKKWRKTSLSAQHFYGKWYYMKKLLSFCGQMQTKPLNQRTIAVFMYCEVTFDYLLRWKSENSMGF